MSIFDERERAFEAKFAGEQKAAFVVHARQSKALGLWAAGRMGLSSEHAEAYAKTVLQADVDKVGQDDVIIKVAADLRASGIPVSESEVSAEMKALSNNQRRFG